MNFFSVKELQKKKIRQLKLHQDKKEKDAENAIV